MPFQASAGTMQWKLHFRSPPVEVFQALASERGRASFWAESAPETDDQITFHILNYPPYRGRILQREAPRLFQVEYFATIVEFTLDDDDRGGTDLTLRASEVDESIRVEMVAGWVSVLMAMKAAVDHGVDLRNHDATRSWGSGYADN